MDIDEVQLWLEGSKIAERVNYVLERRQRLFKSKRWRDLIKALSRYAA